MRGARGAILALAAVLVLAAGLRLWGIGFGLPHPFARPDEEAIMSVALRFFRREANPGFFHYPSLFMYATCVLYVVYFNAGRFAGWFRYEADLVAVASINPGPLYLMARLLSAAAGVITVMALYRVGRVLFDRSIALAGALFLAVAALHVRDSHFGVADVAATCLIVLSFAATARYAASGNTREVIISAMLAGAAASTKYNAALIAAPAIWAVWRGRAAADATATRLRLTGIYVAVMTVVFVAGTPYALLDWPHFIEGIGEISAHLQGGHAEMRRAWIVHASSSLWYGIGWPMLLTSVAGLAWYVRRSPSAGILYAMFPVTYYVGIGSGRTAFARYVLPVVPFLCLAAAYATVTAARALAVKWGRPAWTPVVTGIGIAAVALPSLYAAIASDRLLARTDTRALAVEWIRRRVPAGATVSQSGASYVQAYLRTPPVSEYAEVTWDDGLRQFRDEDGNPTGDPDVIVTPTCPLVYCDVPVGLTDAIAQRYRPVQQIDGYRPTPGLVYDREDAFFVPLAGFSAVDRPGPNMTIYERR